MTKGFALVRVLFLVALSIYIGGFTFYSSVVIPVLHDRLESSFETGMVTQRVTDALNVLGAVTLLLGWSAFGLAVVCHAQVSRWQWGALFTSIVCLIVLVILHRVMDQKLATDSLAGFYPLHRAYLWTSTIQWIANLWLLIQLAGPIIPAQESRR